MKNHQVKLISKTIVNNLSTPKRNHENNSAASEDSVKNSHSNQKQNKDKNDSNKSSPSNIKQNNRKKKKKKNKIKMIHRMKNY